MTLIRHRQRPATAIVRPGGRVLVPNRSPILVVPTLAWILGPFDYARGVRFEVPQPLSIPDPVVNPAVWRLVVEGEEVAITSAVRESARAIELDGFPGETVSPSQTGTLILSAQIAGLPGNAWTVPPQ